MTVSNGQIANAATFNNAFVSRTINTDLAGKFDLKNVDTASGPNIINVQKNINLLYNLIGMAPNQDVDVEILWDDGTLSSIVDKVNELVGSIQNIYTLTNNQSVLTNIAGLLLNSANEKSASFIFEIERIGTLEFRQIIDCKAVYKGTSWKLYFNGYNEDDIVMADDPDSTEKVRLSITSVGQFQYKTGNLAGHTSTRIKVYQIRIKV